MALEPTTVAGLLTDSSTRIAALGALEAHNDPHPTPLAVAAMPALMDVLCLDAEEVDHALFQRVGLLLALLVDEASDSAALWGAANSDGRYSKLFRAPNVVRQLLSKPVAELDQRDAMSYAACGEQVTWYAATVRREWAATTEAAGLGLMEWLGIQASEHPLLSR